MVEGVMEKTYTVENFSNVLEMTGMLIEDVHNARNIFFPEVLRNNFESAYKEFRGQLEEVLDQVKRIENSSIEEHFPFAGLTDAQKIFKFKSLEVSLNEYESKGTLRKLIEALKKGRIIIGSLVGAMPAIGSFIQELIDFILDQLDDAKKKS